MASNSAPRVVIIGAGIGGLAFAIALKRKFAFENFIIYEKTGAVGGAWQENTYPGCSCDIAAPFYSLSSDQNPDWQSSHPFQPEILEYWKNLSHKYALTSHIQVNTLVVEAVWDSKRNCYNIITKDLKTGNQSIAEAEILISAMGILEVPRFPEIPGVQDFEGAMFHSARWVDMDLNGKRVAIIGNGASASQLLPSIAKNPKVHVTQFCRTANWLFPPIRMSYSKAHKFACRYVPFYMRMVRFINYAATDLGYLLVFANSITRRLVEKCLKRYILNCSPEKYHNVLIPNYDLGCRRVIFDHGYLSALHLDNVNINYEGITSIVKEGLVTKEGKTVPFDVIIFATGFCTDAYPLQVEGLERKSIQEYFDSHGGPTVYMGTTVPSFPNFFILGGPNIATGHTSFLFSEEIQIKYILDLIRPILYGRVSSVSVKKEASDRYNEFIQKRLSRSVFVGCSSWYRVNGTGKINSIFPGSAAFFWWLLKRPRWEDYEFTGGDAGDAERTGFMNIWMVVFAIAVYYVIF